jgi:hypothetical protein
VPVNLADSPRLQHLRGICAAINELHTQQAEAVAQARAAGHSWTQVGAALGVARQVAHTRYSDTTRGWQAITAPELDEHGATAYVPVDARRGQATVHTVVDHGGIQCKVTYNPAEDIWRVPEPTGAIELDAILPVPLQALLADAGRAGLLLAQQRHAGIAKWHQTVAERGSAVGRPRKRPRPAPPV